MPATQSGHREQKVLPKDKLSLRIAARKKKFEGIILLLKKKNVCFTRLKSVSVWMYV